MTSLRQRLLNTVSRLLESTDREALLGDIAESASPRVLRPLSDILGLVVRRHVEAWRSMAPWFALLALVLPVGILLSIVSRSWTASQASIVELYAEHFFHAADWRTPGWRHYVFGLTAGAVSQAIALIVWSWTCGLALSICSRKTSRVNGLLFVAAIFAGTVGTTATIAPTNARHLSVAVLLLALLRFSTTALPAILALNATRRQASVSTQRLALWCCAAAACTAITFHPLEGSLFFGWRIDAPASHGVFAQPVLKGLWLPGLDGAIGTADDVRLWPLQVIPMLTLWPAIIVLASTVWGRRSSPLIPHPGR